MHCFLASAIKDDHHTFHTYIHSYVGHGYSILSLERYIHKSRNLCLCTAYPIPKIPSMQPCEHSHVEIRSFHALYSSQVCSFIAHTAQIATHMTLQEYGTYSIIARVTTIKYRRTYPRWNMHCVAIEYNPKTQSCRLHLIYSPSFKYMAEAIHAQSKHTRTNLTYITLPQYGICNHSIITTITLAKYAQPCKYAKMYK